MKKVLLTILGVLLFIPNVLFADMGAPGIEEYKASINNKNGAVVYESDYDEKTSKDVYKATKETIPYGKTVKVEMEENGYADIENYGYVKLSDIEPIQKNYALKDSEWKSKVDGIILKKVELRNGPANGYSKVGVTLEPGTNVKVREYKESDGFYSWVYIEYNGKKGYIDSYQGTVTLGKDKAYFMTFSDTDFNDATTGKKIGTVKANTVISGTYYTLDSWSKAYYFEKDNIKGTISSFDLAQRAETIEGTLRRDVKVYEKINAENLDSEKVITTLKKGTYIKSNIHFSFNAWGYLYYENGNTKGWIDNSDITPDDGSEYSDNDTRYGYPIDYKINEDGEEVIDNSNIEESNTLDVETNTNEPNTDDTNESVPVSPSTLEDDDVTSAPKNTNLYLYIAGAIILFLLAVVIILLVNRKSGKEIK